MSNNLTIDLKAKQDKNGNTFYIGKLEGPVLIDCSEGAVFLIFISDVGGEQLQVASMERKINASDQF
jgi:hypothetical protein